MQCGAAVKPYEFLEKEPIDTEYGVTGLVQERRDAFAARYNSANTLGTVLCILAAVPLFAAMMLTDTEVLSASAVCLLLVLVACGVYAFVRVGTIQDAMDQLLETGDFTRDAKARKGVIRAVSAAYWLVVVAIFLFYTFGPSLRNFSRSVPSIFFSFLQGQALDERQIHIGDLLAVAQLDRGIEQAADVIGAAPDLGHAAVDVQQGVNSFHTGAHGVLGGEDGVAAGLGELAQEGEVDSALGHDVGAVAEARGMKKASIYGIITGTVLALCSASSSIWSSGTPMWYSHSMQISLPVQSRMGFLT